jgi:hypothetical protein
MKVSHRRFYRYGSESGDSDKSICSSELGLDCTYKVDSLMHVLEYMFSIM